VKLLAELLELTKAQHGERSKALAQALLKFADLYVEIANYDEGLLPLLLLLLLLFAFV